MRHRPTKLSDYPWVVVRFDCALCPRRGRYRLARLAARYGPEQDLDGLLRRIAGSCPLWTDKPRKHEARCGARLVDVEHEQPPPDLPPAPVYRQRQPAREDVARPPRSRMPEADYRAPMLSDWPAGRPVVIVCTRCGRRQTFERDGLLARGDMTLVEVRLASATDCPRREASPERERCSTTFEGWPG